jgi:hypothetical protein
LNLRPFFGHVPSGQEDDVSSLGCPLGTEFMQAGLADRVFDMTDLVALIEQA